MIFRLGSFESRQANRTPMDAALVVRTFSVARRVCELAARTSAWSSPEKMPRRLVHEVFVSGLNQQGTGIPGASRSRVDLWAIDDPARSFSKLIDRGSERGRSSGTARRRHFDLRSHTLGFRGIESEDIGRARKLCKFRWKAELDWLELHAVKVDFADLSRMECVVICRC